MPFNQDIVIAYCACKTKLSNEEAQPQWQSFSNILEEGPNHNKHLQSQDAWVYPQSTRYNKEQILFPSH